MAVPLMIKLPQQRDGYIDDSNVETIDVLPTIAQTLGTRLPWVTDGKPVTEAQPAQRAYKTIFFNDATRSFRVAPEELEIKYQTALRKYRLHGQQAADSSWSPVHQELIGRGLARLDVEEDDRIRARLLYPGFFQEVSPGGDFIPCLISGYLERAGDSPVDLALAINGIIQATTRTYGLSIGDRRKGAWEALVPESAFIAGPNLVEILTIRNSESGPRLFRAYSSMQARPSADNLVLEVAQWRWGVEFSGFYSQEWWQDRPARWTDGNASLSIRVDPANPPLALRLKLLHAGPRGTSLRVLADGCPLWDRKLPPGEASLSIALADCPPNSDRLKIELVSDTFVPAEVDPASLDKRRLGVALESLSLTRSEGRSKPDQ